MNKRENWVDVVKGLAIVTVAMFHTTYTLPVVCVNGGNLLPLTQLLGTLWHVPVFLCIGGFFLKESDFENPWTLVKKKWKGLYVKLLGFYLVFILLHNLFFKVGFYSTDALYVGKHIAPYNSIMDYARAAGFALLAAREPMLGAMWFINLMFLGFVIIAAISFVVNKMKVEADKKVWYLGTTLFALAILDAMLTQVCDIHILRATPAVNAAWLVFLGYVVNKVVKVQYNNVFVFVISFLLMYEISSVFGSMSLANDVYYEFSVMTIATLASLYALCFIAKRIQDSAIGKALTLCGKESYYIMALHLLGFKFATLLLNACGMSKPLDEAYSQASTLWEWILYTAFGVIIPILISISVNKIKSLCQKQV